MMLRTCPPLRPLLAFLCAFALVADSTHADDVEEKADGEKTAVPRILMLTQSAGFTHGSVRRKAAELAPAELAMKQLAQKTEAFTVDCTQDAAADFTKDSLDDYDIVMFYTTGKLPIAEADLEYFLNDWLKQEGHGFIGVHSATDTYKDHEPYWEMIGGTFAGHPWNAGTTVSITVHDPKHPTMQPFDETFTIQDEIYQYRNWQPEKVRVLMSLNMAECKPKKPYHVPVAWCKDWGKGKVFVSNLGHREQTWQDERHLKSILGAVAWITGEAEGDATPNPEVSQAWHEKSATDAK